MRDFISKIIRRYLFFYLACHGLEIEKDDLQSFGSFKTFVSVITMRAQRDSHNGKHSNADR